MRKKSINISFIFILIDQIIKLIINNSLLYGEDISLIHNFLYLTNAHNFGAAWSTFSGARYLLIIIAILTFVFLTYYENDFKYKTRTMIGFSLVYGGLFGNLIDRFVLGYVVDYIGIILYKYYFPIFNFADMCLVVGFILIIIAILKGEDKNDNKKSKRKNKNR